ncbi:hypothetical protein MJL27_25555, partial [Salmonella enterica subsp. enterica serovar Anatum]|nr:hypothetical protein [Salmonella enterica subsp. enterica serovar Anatum]
RTSVKLFTRYRLPAIPELTVGGGVNWQNRVYKDTTTPYGTFRTIACFFPLTFTSGKR